MTDGRGTPYLVWVDGDKEEAQIIRVDQYEDGTFPLPMRVKDTACKSIHFGWGDYTDIRFRRLKAKNVEEINKFGPVAWLMGKRTR